MDIILEFYRRENVINEEDKDNIPEFYTQGNMATISHLNSKLLALHRAQ